MTDPLEILYAALGAEAGAKIRELRARMVQTYAEGLGSTVPNAALAPLADGLFEKALDEQIPFLSAEHRQALLAGFGEEVRELAATLPRLGAVMN